MSINGVLEDLPLADVLQFIHLGQRTGTLYLWRNDDNRAEISFHNGRIVGAWTPGQKRIGDQLVDEGLLEPAVLEDSLRLQRGEAKGQSIGQILLARGAIARQEVHRLVKSQIQDTVFDLVTWKQGNFHFEVDDLSVLDDFAVSPGEVLEDVDINTQMLLLEAARIFDERQHSSAASAAGAVAEAPLDRRLKRAGLAGSQQRDKGAGEPRPRPVAAEAETPPPEPAFEALRCQLVSNDAGLAVELGDALPSALARVVAVRLREAGNRVPGESASPLVILDLRSGEVTGADVAALARTRPAAPVIAVVDDADEADAVFAAGAAAVVCPGGGALAAACRNLIRVLSHPQPQGTFGWGRRGGLRRVRRVVFDVQSGLSSATMALNLLHVISESVERAVLFLVQGQRMVAVGAFGFSNDGRSLAEASRGLTIDPPASCALRRAFDDAQPLALPYADADLPAALGSLLGPPASDQVVIFPVLGAERAIAMIYTDNGTRDEEIQDIKILELATSQVGVAFENELLGRAHHGDDFEVDGASFDDALEDEAYRSTQ